MTTDHKKKVAEKIKEARLKTSLTQAEFAKKAGMYANTYAKIERGEQKPSPENMVKLAKALGLDLSDIIKAWS
jgi:transcriptional regulator with XRE-family HTH domain